MLCRSAENGTFYQWIELLRQVNRSIHQSRPAALDHEAPNQLATVHVALCYLTRYNANVLLLCGDQLYRISPTSRAWLLSYVVHEPSFTQQIMFFCPHAGTRISQPHSL